MGRVFDALQREDKNGQRPNGHDPLATRHDELEPLNDFDLPDCIGAPSGPRSTEGVILPFVPEDQLMDAAEAAEPQPRATAPSNSAAEKRPIAEPEPQNTAPTSHAEFRRPLTAVREQFTPPQTIQPHTRLVAQLEAADLHPRVIMAGDQQSPGCEQYRTLRTQVLQAAEQRLTQVIVITSAVEGEGKTSTALNLAFALAQLKEPRVLVIDSDMRRPEMARYLGLAPEKGLEQALNGQCDVMRTVIHVADSHLYLLPTCSTALHPAELLSSARWSEVLTELRRYFDFILVDSPPVTPFADARVLAHQADAVMMVVRAGAAPYSTVERAIAALPAGRFLGAVLNDVAETNDATRYGKRRFFDWLSFGKRKH